MFDGRFHALHTDGHRTLSGKYGYWSAFGLVLGVAVMPAYAKTPEQIFRQVAPSIVVVEAYDKDDNPLNQGGGVVTGRGAIATNCHIVHEAGRIAVRYRDRELEATLQFADHERDLCLLKASQLNTPPVTLSKERLRVGQRVYAVGAPEGLELTISEGLISSLREFEGSQYIQTSAAISQGSSGGGLFDSEGRLVGLTAFYLPEGQNLNFALPVAWIVELASRGTGTTAKAQAGGRQRWAARVDALKSKRDWMGVLALTQQWVRSSPVEPLAWRELGDAYLRLNRLRRSVPAYLQAVRLSPELGAAWSSLGQAYLRLNQHDRALEASEEALRLMPKNVAVLQTIGAAYYFQNRNDKVKEIHETLRKIDARTAEEFAKTYLKR